MMKRYSLIVLAVLALLATTGCSKYKYETVKGDPTNARIYTLDNGLKVYMIVNKDEPRIDAHVAVKVGSKNDPQETTGLAHYFEHLMFKGTKQLGTQDYAAEEPLLNQIEELFEVYRKTTDPGERKAIYHQIDSISYEASKIFIPNEYDKAMAAIGGRGTNAYTSNDVTCYTENIPSNQLENWAKIQADRFENVVLRGFHTELETIYEEYNMYAVMDQEKVSEAAFAALFPKHPYHTPVIGWGDHLKNPSITNVKKYHDQWYVPNNMAVCLVGDFNPDEAIKVIDKYFGPLKPNKDLKKMEFEPEDPITAPVVREVLGLESPSLLLAWRFPGANSPEARYIDLISSILYNGRAGLIDLDVNQQQKTLGMAAYRQSLADYCAFLVEAEPLQGQSLEEVKQIALAEIEKVKKGEFDEELLTSIINNEKLAFMRICDMPRALVRAEVNAFIYDIEWKDFVHEIDELEKITKDDLVAFANEHLKDNYVQINKLEKPDPNDTRIAKPSITPIMMNRDAASQFLRDIQASAAAVQPIEPVFVDYQKDMSIATAKSGIPVLYKQNVTNGIFELQYLFETGSYADNVMPFAADYLSFLGTDDMTPEEVQKAFYRMAVNMSVACSGERTYVSLNGLAENMEEAMELVEKVIAHAQANPEALMMLKGNTVYERRNAKLDQRSNSSRIQNYAIYGPKNPATNVIPTAELMKLSDEALLEKIHHLFENEHKVLYYGPLTEAEAVEAINRIHQVPAELKPVVKGNPFAYVPTENNQVVLAQYDANQLNLIGFYNTGLKFDVETAPIITLYNEYFGGGMNSIVFQEMREARGLAYSARANYSIPGDLDHPSVFTFTIGTQNDKLIDALSAFDEIINEMPVSENAFNIAKESLISNIRTARTTKSRVLSSYLNAQQRGLDYDLNKVIYEKVPALTLDDVVKFQQTYVKGKPHRYGIVGRKSDMDLKTLLDYGTIQQVSTEEIFGY
ncbi:MAG: insulinase family protein [Bacteroidales bacterium]|nr:insulinase family protein [Bacteroidales bacterium]